MTRSLELAAGLLALAVISAAAQDKPTTPLRNFTTLQVDVRVAPTVTSPITPEYIRLLREDILQNVKNRHKFHKVGDDPDPKVAEPEKERSLLLRVEIVAFQPPSQRAQLVWGTTRWTRDKIRAHCQFIEGSSGAVVWDLAVEGGAALLDRVSYRVEGSLLYQVVVGPPVVTGDFTKQFAKLIEQNW